MSDEHLHEGKNSDLALALLCIKSLAEASIKHIKKKVEELEPLDYCGHYKVENFKSDVLSIISEEIDRINKDYDQDYEET